MKQAQELRTGMIFKSGNDTFVVIKNDGTKSGRGSAITKLRIKNIVTGQYLEVSHKAQDKFEEVFLDEKKMSLSYIDGDTYVFMDNETYEQVEIPKEDLGDAPNYLIPEDQLQCEITFFQGKAAGVKLPIAIEREIVYCEPGIKGDTTGKASKPAKLDTGYEIMVPIFCDIGTRIKVDTRDGSYMERVK